MADVDDTTADTPQHKKHKRPHARRSKKNREKDNERARLHALKLAGEVEDDDAAKNLSMAADNAGAVSAEQGNTMTAPAPLAPLVEQGAAIEQDAGNDNDLARLKRQVDALNGQKEGWYEDLRVAREERDEQSKALSALQRQCAAMQRTINEFTADKDAARQAKNASDLRIQKLEKDFAEQKKRAEIAHNVADAKSVTIKELQAELEARDVELDRVKKERDDSDGMVAALHNEADVRAEEYAIATEASAGKEELEQQLLMINERLEETLTEMAKNLSIEEKLAYLQEQKFTKLRRDESQASFTNHRRNNSRMVSLGSIQDELDKAEDTMSESDTEFEREPQPLALSSIITQVIEPEDTISAPKSVTSETKNAFPEPKQVTVEIPKEVIVYRDRPTTSKSSFNRWSWTSIANLFVFFLLLSLSYSAAVARKEWRDVNDTRPAYLRLVDGEGMWDVVALGMGGVLAGSP